MVNKMLNILPILCYYRDMRQKFDVGDLVEVVHPMEGDRGIVIDTKPINTSIPYPKNLKWHPDEYKCKVQFINKMETKWVRAKWLSHLSKIDE